MSLSPVARQEEGGRFLSTEGMRCARPLPASDPQGWGLRNREEGSKAKVTVGRWPGLYYTWWVASRLPWQAPQLAGYVGRSWGWCAGLARPLLGDSLLLSLAKARMGLWAQLVR